MNSVFLLTAVATIVLGTLYPIILDAFNLEKISVGEPYFNTVFLPIILPLLLLMGAAPHVHWENYTFKSLWEKCNGTLLFSAIMCLVLPFLAGFKFHALTAIGIFLSIWVMFATLQYLFRLQKVWELKHWSMVIAHFGIAIVALGITLNKSYSEERQIKISPGEATTLANYIITFSNLQKIAGPNYKSITATFNIVNQAGASYELNAEQRIYTSNDEMLSKPGITANFWRDIYIALGSTLPDGSWSVRMYYKPFVRWIWAGGFLLLVGGLLSLLQRGLQCIKKS